MRTVTVKNIPDELYEAIKKSAAGNRRSVNSEMIVCMERAVRSRRVDPEEMLAEIRTLRSQIKVPPLTDEFLRRAREEGRP